MNLQEVNILSTLIRLAAAVICGGLLGIERGQKKRPAGLRTYIVVCLGSTLAMLVNQYIYQSFGIQDPTRIAAQVISGIGFLGAGTIIVTSHSQVKGLTTAAGLWASASVGLALGIGFYYGAAIATFFIFIVMFFFNRIDFAISKRSHLASFYIESEIVSSISYLLKKFHEKEFQIEEFDIFHPKHRNDSSVAILVTLKSDRGMDHAKLIEWLMSLEGIIYVEEILK